MTTDGTALVLTAGGPTLRRRLAAELRHRREQAGNTMPRQSVSLARL